MRYLSLLLLFFFSFVSYAQEIEATVEVNAQSVTYSNKQLFETLERELTEFINQKKWTNRAFLNQEKIKCAFTLTILEAPSTSEFKGNLQIQSVRPVYNSTYLSSVFNYKDDDVSFQYTEFAPFQYNPNTFDNNLTSIIAFYIYTILGIDSDTFQHEGGSVFFAEAENVVNQAQSSGYGGWNSNDRGQTRFKLINDILAPVFVNFRRAMYVYHREGLDKMLEDKTAAKNTIYRAIQLFTPIYNSRPTANIIRVFMNAKADEIVNIYSGGPRFDTEELKNDLNRISAQNSSKWNEIK